MNLLSAIHSVKAKEASPRKLSNKSFTKKVIQQKLHQESYLEELI